MILAIDYIPFVENLLNKQCSTRFASQYEHDFSPKSHNVGTVLPYEYCRIRLLSNCVSLLSAQLQLENTNQE